MLLGINFVSSPRRPTKDGRKKNNNLDRAFHLRFNLKSRKYSKSLCTRKETALAVTRSLSILRRICFDLINNFVNFVKFFKNKNCTERCWTPSSTISRFPTIFLSSLPLFLILLFRYLQSNPWNSYRCCVDAIVKTYLRRFLFNNDEIRCNNLPYK